MSELIEIFQDYKNMNIDVHLSLKTISKKLKLNKRTTRKILEKTPEIKKKTYPEVNNSGFTGRWLYYLE
jgi:hypothetical protein